MRALRYQSWRSCARNCTTTRRRRWPWGALGLWAPSWSCIWLDPWPCACSSSTSLEEPSPTAHPSLQQLRPLGSPSPAAFVGEILKAHTTRFGEHPSQVEYTSTKWCSLTLPLVVLEFSCPSCARVATRSGLTESLTWAMDGMELTNTS